MIMFLYHLMRYTCLLISTNFHQVRTMYTYRYVTKMVTFEKNCEIGVSYKDWHLYMLVCSIDISFHLFTWHVHFDLV